MNLEHAEVFLDFILFSRSSVFSCKDLKLDFLFSLLNAFISEKYLVVNRSFELRVLSRLSVTSSLQHLLNQFIVTLRLYESLDSPIDFILSEELACIKSNLAESLTLKVRSFAHDRG